MNGSSMANLHEVPVIEVNSDNLPRLWSTIISAIKSATFIAVDTELSGLGDRRRLNAKAVDERYTLMSEVSRTRSILSLGLACFNLVPSASECKPGEEPPMTVKAQGLTFEVQAFNIFVLCSQDYVVEPVSLRFLVNHGFDFNKQYAQGLPYYRGNDKPSQDRTPQPSVRQIFTQLLLSQKPVVFHNAMVDLVYLYQSFYAELPSAMPSFLADVAEIYVGGVFDTKYITEFKARMGASYLEYVFRKCQRENSVGAEKGWSHVEMTFDVPSNVGEESVVQLPCALDNLPAKRDVGKTTVCQNYANHGWCTAAANCPNSHDIDLILNAEEENGARKRRKRRRRNIEDSVENSKLTDVSMETNDSEEITDRVETEESDSASQTASGEGPNSGEINVSEESRDPDPQQTAPPSGSVSRTGGHRAGFDAFMTGFIFAFFTARYGKYKDLPPHPSTADLGMEEFANKVYLGGKDIPLQIMKSTFAKTSKEHRAKQEVLQRLVPTRT